MIKIGLTGGIGSGKSIIAHLFQIKGIPVYIADTESKRLTESSPVIKKGLTELFGEEIYKNHRLNKAVLAGYIFNNKDLLAKVNAIIHPVVLADFINWSTHQNSPIVVIESAILFESGFNQQTDINLMVYAPETLRIKRVEQRDGFPEEEIKKRINNQLSDEKKCGLSDYIIRNTGKEALIPQLEKMIHTFLQQS